MDKPPPYERLKEDLEPSDHHNAQPVDSPIMAPLYPTAAPVNATPYAMLMPSAPTVIMQQPAPVQAPPAVVVINNGRIGGKGRCHACNYGQLKDHYSCCAICWCILCFPIGCICCLCMRNKKCNHCGIEF